MTYLPRPSTHTSTHTSYHLLITHITLFADTWTVTPILLICNPLSIVIRISRLHSCYTRPLRHTHTISYSSSYYHTLTQFHLIILPYHHTLLSSPLSISFTSSQSHSRNFTSSSYPLSPSSPLPCPAVPRQKGQATVGRVLSNIESSSSAQNLTTLGTNRNLR